jgi:hypothetical protein
VSNKATVSTLPGASVPWGRTVEKRLLKVESTLGVHQETIDKFGSQVDKTVVATYDFGMNIGPGVTGKLALDQPTNVKFISSTGLFEVTVSIAGLVSNGSIMGIGFESDAHPYDVYFDFPVDGVVGTCLPTDNRWVPVAASRSTILTTRPGVFSANLYLHVNNTGTTAQAFLKKAQLSIKAV